MNNINFVLTFIFLNLIFLIFNEKISKIINVYDLPNKRKIHKKKTPLLGGYIIFVNIILFSILVFFNVYEFNLINHLFYTKYQYFVFLLALTIFFLVGAIDDKINLNSNFKLLLLTIIISSILFLDKSLTINYLRFSFLDFDIFLDRYSFAFTALCFLLFINACNMFDGINLQSSSYFIILVFYILNLHNNNIFLVFLLISLIIIFKLNLKGKIFMGDSGIYISSFFLSYLIIKNYNINIRINADLIFILMMLPGIDMLRLFIFRILDKKNPFLPDKNHIHHLLLEKFTYWKTIIIINFAIIIPILLSLINFSNLIIIIFFILIYLISILVLKNKYKKLP